MALNILEVEYNNAFITIGREDPLICGGDKSPPQELSMWIPDLHVYLKSLVSIS